MRTLAPKRFNIFLQKNHNCHLIFQPFAIRNTDSTLTNDTLEIYLTDKLFIVYFLLQFHATAIPTGFFYIFWLQSTDSEGEFCPKTFILNFKFCVN